VIFKRNGDNSLDIFGRRDSMDPDDFNYLMRHGELPSKQAETKSKDNTNSDGKEEQYYSYSDYKESKAEKIWNDEETKVPFWVSTISMLVLVIIDLSDGTEFDIEFIFAVVVLWVITFIGLLLLFVFFRWLIRS